MLEGGGLWNKGTGGGMFVVFLGKAVFSFHNSVTFFYEGHNNLLMQWSGFFSFHISF